MLDEKKPIPFHSVVIRIIGSYLQISSIMLSFDIRMPDFVRSMLSAQGSTSAFAEHFLTFECATNIRDDVTIFYLKQLLSIWGIPLASVLLCLLFWFYRVSMQKHKRSSRRHKSFRSFTFRDGFVASLMVLFYTLFISIARRVAINFSCRRYADRLLLADALSIECWTGQHLYFVGFFGLPGMLLFIIITPLSLATILISHRKHHRLYMGQKNFRSNLTLRYGFIFAG